MKRNMMSFCAAVMVLVSVLSVFPQAVLAKDITISTPDELEAFRDSVNSGEHYSGVTVTLTADIDLEGGWDNQWTPIGNMEQQSFTGTFDGGGHKITGLYILVEKFPTHFSGLFGYNSGTVQNLNVTAFISNAGVTGGIVGNNTGIVANCYFSGSVNGRSDTGGVVGCNEGTVTDCRFAGTISSSSDAGGVVGWNNGTVKNCCNNGAVNGENRVGGVVGSSENGTVTNCYNTGIVKGSDYGGKLAGCIYIDSWVGGVVGGTYGNNVVANCYNIGSSGKEYVGGIVGYRDTQVWTEEHGFLEQKDAGKVINCYYLTGVAEKDGDTADKDAGNARAIDEAAFAVQSTFADWDFKNVWTMDEKFQRPVLRSVNEHMDGTVYDPHRITTLCELEDFRDSVNHGITYYGITVTLAADIDLSGSKDNPWIPIGSGNAFVGTFDGGGHRITGLYIETSGSSQGLFARNAGTIQNLGVAGSVSGGSYVGGVVGWNSGTVKNCYYSGSVSGNVEVGGMAGRNDNDVGIINCYSSAAVSGSANVGGVTGSNNNGSIINCYSNGTVSGHVNIGGVVGCHDTETIRVDYAPEVTGCYYLADNVLINSAITNIDAGDSQAIDKAAFAVQFTFADWDFTNIWKMNGKFQRPILRNVSEHIDDTIYQITTLDELAAFRDSVNSGENYSGVTVTLTADIDLGGSEDNQWTPIGNMEQQSFTGTFDGGGHKITGLYINRPNDNYQGLFGCNAGTIQNLSVEGQVVGSNYVGGVAGRNGGDMVGNQEMIECHYAGSVCGDGYVGGVAGQSWGSGMTHCSNEGTITGGHSIGGVAGSERGSTITNCHNKGVVTGNLDIDRAGAIGGVLGHTYYGLITDCYNQGAVVGIREVGGVVGERVFCEMVGCYNVGTVSGRENVGGVMGNGWGYEVINCYNHGTVSGDKNVGGVTGCNDATMDLIGCYNIGTVSGKENIGGVTGLNQRNSVIINCYNTGMVQGDSYAGGVVGKNDVMRTQVKNCYNTGTVKGDACIGGLFGYAHRGELVINCYYLVNAAPTAGDKEAEDNIGAAAIDKAAFAAHTTFADWDFTDTWTMSAALGRPVLRAIPENGSGTQQDCFVDVLQDMWHYEAVQDIFARGLMKGVSETEFAPEIAVTRGMFVTVLYRMEKEPKSAQDAEFTDVAQGAYYAAAVAWASENGIVTGNGENLFAPEEAVTREQMAAMLYRYAQYKGCDMTVNQAASYIDSDSISAYAAKAAAWAFDKHIMQGNETGAFLPEAYATRAEAAAVVRKMTQYLA